jgi:cell division protein ZipA
MDLTIRDWMVVIGVVLIVAVGLDAWRRVRRERYPKVKLKLAPAAEDDSAKDSAKDEQLAWLKELPNGGGRTVDRRHLINATNKSEANKREKAAAAQTRAKPAPAPATAKLKAKTPVPPAAATDDVELVTGMSSADSESEPTTVDWLESMDASDEGEIMASASRPVAADPGMLPREIDPEVFMLNVLARDREGFRGEDILHILLACDLRFGDMNFFHRHEFEAGRGAIQFSVANMMKPGVFDIDRMGDFNTPGLVFFLTLPGPEDMMKAFDYMLETAQAVARNLDGDVLDESRSVLSKQSLEHCRQQIRDLERRLLARAH